MKLTTEVASTRNTIERRLRAVEVELERRDEIIRASNKRIQRLLGQAAEACNALDRIVEASPVIGTPPATTANNSRKATGDRR